MSFSLSKSTNKSSKLAQKPSKVLSVVMVVVMARFSWIHLCLLLGAVIAASHPPTLTLDTLSLSLSHTHTRKYDCGFIHLCIFKFLCSGSRMFVLRYGKVWQVTIHYAFLSVLCPFITPPFLSCLSCLRHCRTVYLI